MSLTSNLERLSDWLDESPCDLERLENIVNDVSRETVYPSLSGSPLLFVGKAALYCARCIACQYDSYIISKSLGGSELMKRHGKSWLERGDNIDRVIALTEADDSLRKRKAGEKQISSKEKEVAYREIELLEAPIERGLPAGGILRNIHPRFTHAHLIGGADAGFIIDGTLWQTRTSNYGLSLSNIKQSLLYVLLDIDNTHQLSAIGFILPRQDSAIEIEIGGLFRGEPIGNLRKAFLNYLNNSGDIGSTRSTRSTGSTGKA